MVKLTKVQIVLPSNLVYETVDDPKHVGQWIMRTLERYGVHSGSYDQYVIRWFDYSYEESK